MGGKGGVGNQDGRKFGFVHTVQWLDSEKRYPSS